MNDFHKKIKRDELSHLCKRANPIDWVRYSLATLVIKTYKHREPFYFYLCLNETLYTVRRKPLINPLINLLRVGLLSIHLSVTSSPFTVFEAIESRYLAHRLLIGMQMGGF